MCFILHLYFIPKLLIIVTLAFKTTGAITYYSCLSMVVV
jgi:hypothetical protein